MAETLPGVEVCSYMSLVDPDARCGLPALYETVEPGNPADPEDEDHAYLTCAGHAEQLRRECGPGNAGGYIIRTVTGS